MDQKKFISVSVLLILLLVSSVLAFEKIENPFEEKDKYHKSNTGEYSKAMNILEGLGLDGNKQGLKDFQSNNNLLLIHLLIFVPHYHISFHMSNSSLPGMITIRLGER